VLIASAVTIAVGIAIGRQFVPMFGPRAPREILAELSGLPLPWFLPGATGSDHCDGRLCHDYDARAEAQLSTTTCKRAAARAPELGYRPLPVDSVALNEGYGRSIPVAAPGFYRYRRLGGEYEFVSLNTATCVLSVRLDIE
jgi:hypothetical protein